MITADKLRQITETSRKRIDDILARIEPELIKRAEAGFRDYACYKEVEWEAERVHYARPPITQLQQKLVDELKKFGYNAAVEAHGDTYTPRSLDDEDLHQNYVLVIKW